MAIYTGETSLARRVGAAYIGVNGTARKITKGYVGVEGTARLFYLADAGSGSAWPTEIVWTAQTSTLAISDNGYSLSVDASGASGGGTSDMFTLPDCTVTLKVLNYVPKAGSGSCSISLYNSSRKVVFSVTNSAKSKSSAIAAGEYYIVATGGAGNQNGTYGYTASFSIAFSA